MTVPQAEAIGRKPILLDKTPIRKPDSMGKRLVHKAAEFALNTASFILFTAVSDSNVPTPQTKEPKSTDQTDAAVHTRIVLFQRERRPKRRKRPPFRRSSIQSLPVK